MDRAVSEEICAAGSVIAGCSCATTLARVMLYDLLLRGRSALQVGRVVNVIDDVAGHGIGSRGVLVRQITAFVDGVVQMLAAKRLPINWTKTKAMGTENRPSNNASRRLKRSQQVTPVGQ